MKKSLKILLLLLCLFMTVYCIRIHLYWVTAVILFLGIVYFANKYFLSHLNNSRINFMKDKRRNFDTIIIGRPSEKENRIQTNTTDVLNLTNRKRSLFASYLFLIHYYSFLREDGKGMIYIIKNRKEEENYITIYDWVHFHSVIKSRLKLNNRFINRIPLLFCCRKFKIKDFFIDKKGLSLEKRILTFCQERQLNIKIITR